MAIPSGSGSEVLKAGFIDGCDGWTYIRWDQAETADGNTSGTGTTAVPANCIITLLNMIFCQESGTDSLISLRTEPAGAGVINILHHAGNPLPANKSFTYSERLVLNAGDQVIVYSNYGTDIVYSYIYQDWT